MHCLRIAKALAALVEIPSKLRNIRWLKAPHPRGMRLLKAVYSVMCNSILEATWPHDVALAKNWIPRV